MALKKRLLYSFLIALTIPAGLGTRIYASHLPHLLATYGGDALYSTCLFFVVRFIITNTILAKVALITYIISVAVELMQLYHAPWIESIRHTPPFGLVLGYGFVWSDLLCYLAGTLFGWVVGFLAERQLLNLPANAAA